MEYSEEHFLIRSHEEVLNAKRHRKTFKVLRIMPPYCSQDIPKGLSHETNKATGRTE